MPMIGIIFTLLILFQIKHLLADYPLQTPYMLGKFKDKGWVLPLAAHCAVHALMTTIIVYIFTKSLKLTIILACFDFIVHFTMDRLKAGSKYLGRFKALSGNEYVKLLNEMNEMEKLNSLDPEVTLNNAKDIVKIQNRFKNNQYFWYALGLDQTVHHLTHYVIIFLTLKGL